MSQPSDDQPIALEAYEKLAVRYAARIDTKPHNAYLERPTVMKLMPDVAGKRVFDAGCGPGWYATWLLDHGAASVTGVDVSPTMIALAEERARGRADLRVWDLAQPLDFLDDGAFDLVLCTLAIHYLPDLGPPLREFSRVLRPGGIFLFSTDHPMAIFPRFSPSGNYFATELLRLAWRGFGGEPVEVPWFRYPLGLITESLWAAGFVIERLVEAQPGAEFAEADPEHYEKYQHLPSFMAIRARKDSAAR